MCHATRNSDFAERLPHFVDLPGHGIVPVAEAAVRVDRGNPATGSSGSGCLKASVTLPGDRGTVRERVPLHPHAESRPVCGRGAVPLRHAWLSTCRRDASRARVWHMPLPGPGRSHERLRSGGDSPLQDRVRQQAVHCERCDVARAGFRLVVERPSPKGFSSCPSRVRSLRGLGTTKGRSGTVTRRQRARRSEAPFQKVTPIPTWARARPDSAHATSAFSMNAATPAYTPAPIPRSNA